MGQGISWRISELTVFRNHFPDRDGSDLGHRSQANEYDVLGIGNALVDILSYTQESILAEQGVIKGSMSLITAPKAAQLSSLLTNQRRVSGGAAANTMVGLAALGSRTSYIGKVGNDDLGDFFRSDIQAAGVHFQRTPAALSATGQCLVMVTPDAARTMNTFLGAASEITPDDIPARVVENSGVVYLEGSLWDSPTARQAAYRAIDLAQRSRQVLVALGLSDSLCVQRHREDFRSLIGGSARLIFADQDEVSALCQTASIESAVDHLRTSNATSVITRGEQGSLILAGEQLHQIAAQTIGEVVDTTGAGDLYAAGFLHGYVNRYPLPECGRMGALAAAEVITHLGGRPEIHLQNLFASQGLHLKTGQ